MTPLTRARIAELVALDKSIREPHRPSILGGPEELYAHAMLESAPALIASAQLVAALGEEPCQDARDSYRCQRCLPCRARALVTP